MSENQQIAGARHLASRLRAESLQDRDVLRRTDAVSVRTLLPGAVAIKLGGNSILDRGPEALLPVVTELGALSAKHALLITAGEGVRARHAYGTAADLGLPTGMLAALGDWVTEQNALIVRALMMEYGAVSAPVGLTSITLNGGQPVVMSGMPPFGLWEPPPGSGRIPDYRTDAGTFLTAEVFGCAQVIYVKDQDGLYDSDPAVNPRAELIREISITELIVREPTTLPIEPVVLQLFRDSRLVKKLQIVNGLKPGAITRALAGEAEGSVITSA